MEIKPPNIGIINTDPGIKDIPPEEAEVRRLQQLVFDHQKQVDETIKALQDAIKEQQKKQLLDMKKSGLPIDEAALARLM